jgi:hypothetical protein
MSTGTEQKTNQQWERIPTTSDYDDTKRLKVVGGWVVKHESWSGENTGSIAMCFVPDPNHEWSL